MKLKIWLLGCLVLLLWEANLIAQMSSFPRELRRAKYTSPEEIISLSGTMSFSQALLIFNDLSKKYLGKVIIDPENRNFPIGVDVNKMYWMDAFELVLRKNKLWYEELPDYIKIIPVSEDAAGLTEEERKELEEFNSREVVISAIFFEGDAAKLRQAGMSWQFFRGSGVNLGVEMNAGKDKPSTFRAAVNPDLDFGYLLAEFQALENDKIGEVIASPQITVKSGQEGRIQVGSDVAVTIRDFAGNTVTQFYSTGSIIKVKPVVIRHDSIDFIHLELHIERSNTANSEQGLEIKKSTAETSILMLDGEETIIGGLTLTEEATTREGIPFLKDLPWWFFGLRYVFGHESKISVKKELIIFLKVELLPTLQERFERELARKKRKLLLYEYRKKLNNRIEFYRKQGKIKVGK